ncbi:hypothetical protein SPHINGO391_300038 [Sphingomonas aurantiaca]|uniref:Uncharacterized protein n=1 Tax=Sphingomonas aurantiaca TaxID=185949 RepID=A0A5E7XXZ8_9SPHN|nr:hypothetical protein SPHINGO391_300038 [Sphingomonas aurantiaca]
MRPPIDRHHADRCLSVLLRLQGLRCGAPPQCRGLLRLLLVRGRAMPPDSGGARVRINGELLHLIASGDQHLSAIYTRSREEAHARNL